MWAVHFGDDDSGRVGRTSKSAGSGKLFWAAASWPGRAYSRLLRLVGSGELDKAAWFGLLESERLARIGGFGLSSSESVVRAGWLG